MSEQIGKLKNKVKAIFAELRQFEEYVDSYLKEVSFQVFTIKELQAALITHFKCDDEIMAIIKQRQADAEKEKARLAAEIEAKKAERESEASKVHEAMGSDGLPNAN